MTDLITILAFILGGVVGWPMGAAFYRWRRRRKWQKLLLAPIESTEIDYDPKTDSFEVTNHYGTRRTPAFTDNASFDKLMDAIIKKHGPADPADHEDWSDQ